MEASVPKSARIGLRVEPLSAAWLRRSAVNWWPCLDKTALTPIAPQAGNHTQCGNCGSPLTGPYCSTCGQHAHESARSIAALFHDAWHIATHVDDRLWQTMYTLLLRPGKLTREYFADHRARYLPPVRVYLVLSVLFFAFSPFSSHNIASYRALRAAPVQTASIADSGGTKATPAAAEEISKGWTSVFKGLDCNTIQSDLKWLEKSAQDSCRRNINTHGEAIKNAFISNIPKMMFVFVPLMALTMLLLYWWPRHYYVEHLVFFLHTHAAVFLILLVETLLSWIATLLGWKASGKWVIVLITLYMIWYVYRAMRLYYGQGRMLTLTKLGVVGFAYLLGFSITLLFTLVLSAIFA
jgi:Protein of unknown function (DUF3667)